MTLSISRGSFVLLVATAIALTVPFIAFADADGTPPNPPSITVNGAALPPVAPFSETQVATSSTVWAVVLAFDEDISNLPSVTDGTPSFGFSNGTAQTVDDCADTDSKTFCFTYVPPAGIEAAVFWFFKVSGAQDLSGEAMADATYRFVADTAGPILTFTQVESGDSLPTISGDSSFASALITLTLAGPVSRTYATQAVGGSWTYTLAVGDELPEGSYTVTATGIDQYQNVGAAIQSTLLAPAPPPPLDTTPPTLSEMTPIGSTSDTTPSYSFFSSEAGPILYTGSCSSPDIVALEGMNTVTLYPLALGTYSDCALTVTDGANNTSAPLSMSPFSIIPPVSLSITGGPAEGSLTNNTSATFTFTSNSPTLCSIDNAPAAPCTGSYEASGLGSGTHVFTVTATNAGNESLSESRTWSIDATAPTLAEVTAILTTEDTTPSYTFSSSEAGTISYGGACQSAATAAVAGTLTIDFSELLPGTYVDCTVTVTDALGNASAPLMVSAFSIVPPPPALGSLMVTVTSTGGDGTFTFTGDLGTFTVTTSGGLGQREFADLPAGTYHVTPSASSGWSVGPNSCAEVAVVAGEEAACAVSFAKNTSTLTKGYIVGLLFHDKDGDAKLDKKGEVTLFGSIGWKVYLDLDNDAMRDSGEPYTTTSLFGLYLFKNVAPGTYTVRVEPKSGKTITKPQSGFYTATVVKKHATFAGLFGWH